MNRDMLETVTRDEIKNLSFILAKVSRLGRVPMELTELIGDLTVWIKSGHNDFNEWRELMERSNHAWLTWFDMWSQINTRPMDNLGGLSITEWYEQSGVDLG
jgi:hypothetical protein